MTPLEVRCRLQAIQNIRVTVAAFLLRVAMNPRWRV